jgi:hypothetical protein
MVDKTIYIEKIKISPKIYLLKFKSQKEMANTFLRFQEYYESPKFIGRVFTHKEYHQWYKTQSKKKYHEDWKGFNIPETALTPFKKGKFDPLTEGEKKLLSLFKNTKGKFYIISFSGGRHHILRHEMAHALFYINPKYRKEVLKILKKYNTKKIKKELLSTGGYEKKVLDEEVHAYAVSSSSELNSVFPKKLRREVNTVFSKYCSLIIH